jgi:hypothetical protein
MCHFLTNFLPYVFKIKFSVSPAPAGLTPDKFIVHNVHRSAFFLL